MFKKGGSVIMARPENITMIKTKNIKVKSKMKYSNKGLLLVILLLLYLLLH